MNTRDLKTIRKYFESYKNNEMNKNEIQSIIDNIDILESKKIPKLKMSSTLSRKDSIQCNICKKELPYNE